MSGLPPGKNLLSRTVSGLFLIDKPAELSSFAALGNLKRAINTKKVGHAGTLDPFATGLLLALSGKMTRSAFLFSNLDKEYSAVFRFGEETDTLDSEGTITETAPVPAIERITQAAEAFKGGIRQIPPQFSAVKIQGKRAYKQAREGRSVEMPERTVLIHDFEILNWKKPDLEVRIRCSKGTYIRSVARDLGLASGSRAFCAALRRTAIGPFRVENAVPSEICGAENAIAPAEAFALLGIPRIEADEPRSRALRAGVPFERIDGLHENDSPLICWVEDGNNAVALTKNEMGHSSYVIVFDRD